MKPANKYNLEKRIVIYASLIIEAVDSLSNSFVNSHLGKQLIRSGTSAALNYAEAQVAESKADFIHKMKLALKELKESQMCLNILLNRSQNQLITSALKETNELVAIFISSIKTARRKDRNTEKHQRE